MANSKEFNHFENSVDFIHLKIFTATGKIIYSIFWYFKRNNLGKLMACTNFRVKIR